MSIRYTQKQKGMLVRNAPVYICQRKSVETGEKVCQSIVGTNIDRKISDIVKDRLTPEAIRVSVEVQKEVNRRKGEQSRYFQLQVEKARYEADLARRRFMGVDPDNRLVALELESAWNLRLSQLQEAEKKYEDEWKKNQSPDDGELEQSVEGLSGKFHKIWDAAELKAEDKKRIVRYLIEDVTLVKKEETTMIQLRFRGGTAEEVEVPNTLPTYKLWQTSDAVLDILKREGTNYTFGELAAILNESGYRSGKGRRFDGRIVAYVMREYGIPTKKDKYLSLGYITTKEKAEKMGISPSSLRKRIEVGTYEGEVVRVTDGDLLFKP